MLKNYATLKTLFPSVACAWVFILVLSIPGLAQDRNEYPAPTLTTSEPHRLKTEHLPNAIQIHGKVISGGQPDGEQGFLELKNLGVKTIISVDGAKPELALARKYGLRYVHLPHGYNGILPERAQELAKAVRDLDGPIYIHCHHGKHRSPAAAAVACVSAGLIEPSSTLAILKLAGTNENYRGLFESVASAQKFATTILDDLETEFPESAILPPIAKAMVELEHTHNHLNQLAARRWRSQPTHPELEPAHEALLLREHFNEMLHLNIAAGQPDGFQKLLEESEYDAVQLEEAVRKWKQSDFLNSKPAAMDESLRRINDNCAKCHRLYRDITLGSAK